MASKKASRKRSGRTEYWILDRGILLSAGGRPIILKDRKTAERFIVEMGMGEDWKIEACLAPVRETRGRKSKSDPTVIRGLLAWAMTKPKERPTHFDCQRKFMERFRGPLPGSPIEKRKAVQTYFKQIRRLHERAEANLSIDHPLSL